MAPIPAPIFTLEIPPYKSATHTSPPGGTFTLTQPQPKFYLLTFNSPPDNRLTPPFLNTFSLALDIILTKLPPGVLVTTSAIPKFYSNGLDYAGAISDPNFMTRDLFPLWRKLVTFPWPTVAVMNGHTFAGGLMTAMCHDYRVMNPDKGFVCLNEVDFNAPLLPAMGIIFRVKCSMAVFRMLSLEGKRLGGAAAKEVGLVDGLGGVEDAVKLATELGLVGKLRPVGKGSFGQIKEVMYAEIIDAFDQSDANRGVDRNLRVQAAHDRAEAWKSQGGALGVPPSSKL